MTSIDEAIARERQEAKEQRDHIGTFDDEYSKKCEVWAEEHEQIAEWLEELKVYQQHEIICNKGYNAGYNKAIDEFTEKLIRISDTLAVGNDNTRKYLILHFKEMAEQLKAGGENENYNKEES